MKIKRKKLPGVTLLELVIVLAIFSGIAVGAIAMIRPALQVYNQTAAQEKALSCIDSMARYIEDNLRYASNTLVYVNHGIEDIDKFQNYPFDYGSVGVEFINQQPGQRNVKDKDFKDVNIGPGEIMYHHFLNPVSFFAEYYYTDSIGHPLIGGGNDKKIATPNAKKCDNYYKYKTIYIMEIKDDGEINIYEYPLANRHQYEQIVYNGQNGSSTIRNDTTISKSFGSGIKGVEVNNITLNNKLNCDLVVKYSGATKQYKKKPDGTYLLDSEGKRIEEPITLTYNLTVNFLNASEKNEIWVKDTYPYFAQTYKKFDWKDKEQDFFTREKGPGGGYTYIVYSLPEIIPTEIATETTP